MKSGFQGGSGRVLNPVKILKVFGGGKKKLKKGLKFWKNVIFFFAKEP